MDSFLISRVLFLMMFMATCIYWFTSFKDTRNIVYKLHWMHRWPYMLGLIWVAVASLNMAIKPVFSIFDLNMFLTGAFITMGTVAFWDKKATDYYNPPEDES